MTEFYNLGYGRVSKAEQADFYNAAKQQRSRLERSGCTEIFFDIQSRMEDDRPEFQKLLERVKTRHNCHRVTVTRDDRITGNVKLTLEILEIFYKNNVELCVLDGGGVVDLSNPYEWKQRVDAGVSSQFEIKMLQMRVKKGYEEFRLQKKANPKVPYGYKRVNEKYELVPELEPVIRDIVETFIENRSVSETCIHIYKQYGVDWHRSTFKRWIFGEVLRGNTPYCFKNDRPTEIIYDTHPEYAIITPEQDEIIREIFAENRKLRGKNITATRYVLGAGLCKCARCGSSMVAKQNKMPGYPENYYYLRCSHRVEHQQRRHCSMRHTPSCRIVEDEIIKALCEAASEIESFMSIARDTPVEESSEIRELRRQHSQLTGSHPAIVAARNQIEEEINQKLLESGQKNKVASVKREALVKIGSNPQFWRELPDEKRRQYYRMFVDKVTIDGNKPDPTKRLVDWTIEVFLSI